MADRDIWNDPNWMARRRLCAQYRQWFDGAKLGATSPTRDNEGRPVKRYPLDINLAELGCTIHRDLARGMPDQDDALFVYASTDRKVGAERAEELDAVINEGVWLPSHGGPLQQEALLAMMVYGGTVLKLSWEPWEIFDLPYGMAVRLIKNPSNIQPTWDWLNPWKLTECYVGYEISAADAKVKYGINTDAPTALYMEHWTPYDYQIAVDDKVVSVMWEEERIFLKGENPLGFVPIFYVPHERSVQELFGDSMVPRQRELVLEINSRVADLADIVRKSLPGIWVGSDLGHTLNVKRVTANGQLVAKIVDIGRTRPMQGGSAKPTVSSAPMPDLPEELSRFPNTLLNFWMMMSRISPAVFGLDDTSSGRITGPAIAQRMWTSIAHAITVRCNFADAKTQLDKAILRTLVVKKGDLAKLGASVPEGLLPSLIARMNIRQLWPEMIPLDKEVKHREMIERLAGFGISIESYLTAMGVEDVEGERERIMTWMDQQAETEEKYKPEPQAYGGPSAGNKTANKTKK